MKLNKATLTTVCVSLLLTSVTAHSGATGQQRAEAAGRTLIGSPAPRIVVKTIDGDTIDLGSLYGKKAVYLKFWATWCTPCREQMPHFQRAYATAGPDLAVIAVNVGFNDSVEEVRKYRRQLGITMPIVFDADGQLGAAFHLRVTPQHIVIGRDGRIQYVGHLADERLDAALLAARMPESGPTRAAKERAVAAEAHYGVGDEVPSLTVRTVDGKPFPLRTSRPGGPTVYVFLSPWCESYLATTRPVVSENCRIAREQVTSLAADRHVRWLGVASGLWATPSDLREYRTKYRLTIPLTLDESGALFRQFNVANTPTLIVADAHGKIVQRIDSGEADTIQHALQGL